jgi:DNA-binding helix-hairpin-helix protein with protein kinase domain
MKKMESTPGELEKWTKANYEFACEKYGKENIIRFSLHRDETTPHIHCVVVPLTDDGRLSAKEVVGNRNDLKSLQDNYAEAMKLFGLERGVEGSLAAHTGREEYIKKQNLAGKEIENLTVKGFFGIDKDKTIENLKSALIETKTSLKMINASQESIKKQGASFKNQNLSLSQGLKEKEKEVREAKTTANENYKKIIFQPEVFQRTKIHFENAEKERFEKAKIEAEKQKILEEKKQSKGKGFRK